MTPKNKLQTKVIELSSQLPKISEKQNNWASEKIFLNWGVVSRSKFVCLDCNHSWKPENNNIEVKNTNCPSCKKTLKITPYNKVNFEEKEYFAVLTTIEKFQVVRIICSRKFMHKNKLPEYAHAEVMQHFITEKGNVTTLSKRAHGFTQEYDKWDYSSELTIKTSSQRGSQRFRINPWMIYPQRKVLPILKRNGFKTAVYGIPPQELFTVLLADSKAETLLKIGQISAFIYYLNISEQEVNQLWNTIKLCTKNKYIIQDFSIYKDYIKLLRYFNKDIHSPKYICPVDLNKSHDKLVAKKRAIETRIKIEENKKKIRESQKTYLKQKQDFFGLQFSAGKILVKTIEHVQDFLEEGDELRHCVFTNEYYEKSDSLIMSASIDGQRVETIEISLSKMSIIQSRGLKNKATKHHEKIIDLVTKNLPKVKKIYQEKSKQVA